MTRGHHRGGFELSKLTGSRFELALDRFRLGETIVFHDIGFSMPNDGAIVCVVDSSWDADSVTAARATRDLDAAKNVLNRFMESSPAFAALVRDKTIRYELVEDYGTECILICSWANDGLAWERGFPRGSDRTDDLPYANIAPAHALESRKDDALRQRASLLESFERNVMTRRQFAKRMVVTYLAFSLVSFVGPVVGHVSKPIIGEIADVLMMWAFLWPYPMLLAFQDWIQPGAVSASLAMLLGLVLVVAFGVRVPVWFPQVLKTRVRAKVCSLILWYVPLFIVQVASMIVMASLGYSVAE